MLTGSSIVGTWNTFVDWGDTGSPIIANPLTFNPDGSWTYRFRRRSRVQVMARVIDLPTHSFRSAGIPDEILPVVPGSRTEFMVGVALGSSLPVRRRASSHLATRLVAACEQRGVRVLMAVEDLVNRVPEGCTRRAARSHSGAGVG